MLNFGEKFKNSRIAIMIIFFLRIKNIVSKGRKVCGHSLEAFEKEYLSVKSLSMLFLNILSYIFRKLNTFINIEI